ncbi:MAG: hypothetical protein VKL59_03255 [Nostocaceae cyanobacterium]|nr:hypothetical protein [Nostocaceae cyanobacterium]
MFSLPGSIEELVQDIFVCRKVTDTDRSQLKKLLLSTTLSEEEHILIDRLLYGVRKGLLTVEC